MHPVAVERLKSRSGVRPPGGKPDELQSGHAEMAQSHLFITQILKPFGYYTA